MVAMASVACAQTGAPGGLYRMPTTEQSSCLWPVRTLSSPPPVAFKDVATISVVCPYTSPRTCDRLLLARACDLGADAIIAQASGATGRTRNPPLVEEAIAIRFLAPRGVR